VAMTSMTIMTITAAGAGTAVKTAISTTYRPAR
jgi:hypothetical protein